MSMQTEISRSHDLPPLKLEQTATSQDESMAGSRRLRQETQAMRVHETSDGLGSHVRRCIGNSKVRCLPPFISCDFFRINDVGLPPHPSRGSQKVTAVLSGTLSIEYSPSDVIELEEGNVTSLMVGRGVLRSMRAVTPSEDSTPKPPTPPITSAFATKAMPRTEATGVNLFMDVPEPFKRIDSSHIDLCHSDLESFNPKQGVYVRIVTGSGFGRKAPQMLTATPTTILDITIEPDSTIDIPVRPDWNAFVFVIEGKAIVQGEKRHKFDYIEFRRPTMKRAKKRRHASIEEKAQESLSEDPKGAAGESEADAKDTEEVKKPEPSSFASPSSASNSSASSSSATPSSSGSTASQQNQGRWPLSESVVEVSVDAKAPEKCRLFFCAAEPLGQPIYRQGPFVDVSIDGIHQAFDDYAEQKNGFETRRVWQNGSQLDGAASSANGGDEDDPDTEPYNPCDDGPGSDCEDGSGSDDGDVGMNAKATFPNAFPPGKVNPAEQSTEFNGNESVEKQQQSKVPKRPRRDSTGSDSDDGSDGGPERPQ